MCLENISKKLKAKEDIVCYKYVCLALKDELIGCKFSAKYKNTPISGVRIKFKDYTLFRGHTLLNN